MVMENEVRVVCRTSLKSCYIEEKNSVYCESFGQGRMSQDHFNLSDSRFHEATEIHP